MENNSKKIKNAAKNKETKQKYAKWKVKNAAKNKGMTEQEYAKWIAENTAKNKGMTLEEYRRSRDDSKRIP